MPRSPRIDAEDCLYHVIARGVERRAIFRSDRDRHDFMCRLERLTGEEDVELFAYVLMDNHFHLVLRRRSTALARFMRRLLTGHAVVFNLRHQRSGHLFQNRYKAVLCAEEAYLLTLVRYVHLNPVRAGIVRDPAAYAWSSHASYMRRTPPQWLATQLVTDAAGGRAAFLRFVREGVGEERRDDLNGRTSEDSQGNGSVEQRLWYGGQVLGSQTHADRVAINMRQRQPDAAYRRGNPGELPELVASAERRGQLPIGAILSRSRTRRVSAARAQLICTAVFGRGIRAVDVARFLGVSAPGVAGVLRKAERKKLTS